MNFSNLERHGEHNSPQKQDERLKDAINESFPGWVYLPKGEKLDELKQRVARREEKIRQAIHRTSDEVERKRLSMELVLMEQYLTKGSLLREDAEKNLLNNFPEATPDDLIMVWGLFSRLVVREHGTKISKPEIVAD